MTEGPFPVMRTVFFPMFDNGSSFFVLIFAYMSLLNLVVISARGKHLCKKKIKKKKNEKHTKKSTLTILGLTLFSFNNEITQDEGGRFWSKIVEGKGPWVHEIVPALNCTHIINGLLHSFLVPALKFGLPLNCAKQEVEESVAITVNKIELK